MQNGRSPLSPDQWLRDVFQSKAVQNGAVIRRKARDIERYAGMNRFLAEIDRRGFQVVENAGQFVIFCNHAPIRPVRCAPHALSLKESAPKSFKDFEPPNIA